MHTNSGPHQLPLSAEQTKRGAVKNKQKKQHSWPQKEVVCEKKIPTSSPPSIFNKIVSSPWGTHNKNSTNTSQPANI